MKFEFNRPSVFFLENCFFIDGTQLQVTFVERSKVNFIATASISLTHLVRIRAVINIYDIDESIKIGCDIDIYTENKILILFHIFFKAKTCHKFTT